MQNLAQLLVHNGLGLKAGQQLVASAPFEAMPLIRAVAIEAYKVGCSLVTSMLADDAMNIIRAKWTHEEYLSADNIWLTEAYAKAYEGGAARLAITGCNPNLYKNLDQSRIRAISKSQIKSRQIVSPYSSKSIINWTVAPYPFKDWATAIWPDVSAYDAQTQLWSLLRSAYRLDEVDPLQAWKNHNNQLYKKASQLNRMRFEKLHFRGPGTDLSVGLADQHNWHGGKTIAQNGCVGNTNLPTEEIFTCPHALKVNGHVTSTRPLVFGGQKIDGIYAVFENGVATTLKSINGQSIAPLETLLSADDGARRLGEVALVPHSSHISRMNQVFFNTLLDENSSCHIAFGQAYSKTLNASYELSEKALLECGANYSSVHFDWMIGSEKLDINGIVDGAEIALFRSGEWTL
ncbi:MAG: aminopeptidase [Hyphomicrobiaceae bacterium]|nr:aminopeptidase [Hyphomicrobiaceae bacterium]